MRGGGAALPSIHPANAVVPHHSSLGAGSSGLGLSSSGSSLSAARRSIARLTSQHISAQLRRQKQQCPCALHSLHSCDPPGFFSFSSSSSSSGSCRRGGGGRIGAGIKPSRPAPTARDATLPSHQHKRQSIIIIYPQIAPRGPPASAWASASPASQTRGKCRGGGWAAA